MRSGGQTAARGSGRCHLAISNSVEGGIIIQCQELQNSDSLPRSCLSQASSWQPGQAERRSKARTSPSEPSRWRALLGDKHALCNNLLPMSSLINAGADIRFFSGESLQIGKLHPGPCTGLPRALSPKPVCRTAFGGKSLTGADVESHAMRASAFENRPLLATGSRPDVELL